MSSPTSFTSLFFAYLAAAIIAGCFAPAQGGGSSANKKRYEPFGVAPYEFYDGDAYLMSGVDPAKYKRVAVLYVGKTISSSVVQEDRGNGAGDDGGGEKDASAVLSIDTLFYSNALAAAFSRKGASLVERNQINALVREQRLAAKELMDLSDKEKAQRLGKLLKADLLVQGSVFLEEGGYRFNQYGKPFFSDVTGITVTAIDTATGQVVWLNTTLAKRYVSSNSMERNPANANVSHVSMVGRLVDRVVNTFFAGGAR